MMKVVYNHNHQTTIMYSRLVKENCTDCMCSVSWLYIHITIIEFVVEMLCENAHDPPGTMEKWNIQEKGNLSIVINFDERL